MSLLNLQNRCPLTFGLSVLFVIFGVCGYLVNTVFLSKLGWVLYLGMPLNLAVSSIVAIGVTRKVAPFVASTIPSDPKHTKMTDFIGCRAKVSNILDSEEGGKIIIERYGASISHSAILVPGYEGEALRRPQEVVIIDFREGKFICALPPESLVKA